MFVRLARKATFVVAMPSFFLSVLLFFLWAILWFPGSVIYVFSADFSHSFFEAIRTSNLGSIQFHVKKLLMVIFEFSGWVSLIALCFFYRDKGFWLLPKWLIFAGLLGMIAVWYGLDGSEIGWPPTALLIALLFDRALDDVEENSFHPLKQKS